MPDNNHKIKAVIADDELFARDHIKEQLMLAWPDLDIVGEAENGLEAKRMIFELRPDCAFLDIKMPGLSGMEVAKETTGICRIVFITAYDRYAVDAFETEAVDYILKPATDERLVKAVNRLKTLIDSKSPVSNMSEIFERLMGKMDASRKPRNLQWIRVQVKDNVILVPVEEIFFLQARDKYTAVVTKDEEHLIRKTIAELAEELDPDMFFQIHRGTIVNARFIEKISTLPSSRGQLKLKGRPEVHTISRSYSSRFKQM